MANERKKQQDNSIAEGIKNTAGSAFETMHNALELTENAAMNTVDATKNAVDNLTDNDSEERE
jgi:hypothetical protein